MPKFPASPALAAFVLAVISTCSAMQQLQPGVLPKVILVAAGTANTGGNLVRELSADGKTSVRAMVKSKDDPRAKLISDLPGVVLVEADFDDRTSIAAALVGVDRAMLVTSAFDHLQFERETNFIKLAADAGVPVVRVGTCSFLTAAFSKTAYGRAHHGIEAYAAHHGYPVITLRPNWFMDNLLFAAGEITSSGQITYPTAGNGPPTAMIDPRDLASAASHILMLPGDLLASFVAAQLIEVHGKQSLNLAENVAALSRAVGYPIQIHAVPYDDWVQQMVGYGMPRVFAEAFGGTIMKVDGTMEADGPMVQTTSPLLTSTNWAPKYSVQDWASSSKVLGALKKEGKAEL